MDKTLVNHAAIAFSDIIKNWNDTHKLSYVENLIQNIREASQHTYIFQPFIEQISLFVN